MILVDPQGCVVDLLQIFRHGTPLNRLQDDDGFFGKTRAIFAQQPRAALDRLPRLHAGDHVRQEGHSPFPVELGRAVGVIGVRVEHADHVQPQAGGFHLAVQVHPRR